jgi:CBS domain containing-hemolysin-like protein
MILAVSRRTGVLTEAHGRLLSAALDFPDRAVRQLMVPRADILYLDVNAAYEENRRRALEYGQTRFPLCDGGVDHIVGIVHVKDIFMAAESATPRPLRAVARPPLYFPESASIQNVLTQFQKQRVHLGIVVDEYGGTAGLVTMEDILEELIGEIQDEFDQESPRVQALPDGRLLVDASMTIGEFESIVDVHEDVDEEVETVGGLVLARLGRIARVGDGIEFAGRRVEVARVRGRRILRVFVS